MEPLSRDIGFSVRAWRDIQAAGGARTWVDLAYLYPEALIRAGAGQKTLNEVRELLAEEQMVVPAVKVREWRKQHSQTAQAMRELTFSLDYLRMEGRLSAAEHAALRDALGKVKGKVKR